MDAFLASCPALADADRRAFLYADPPPDNPEGARQAEDFWAHTLAAAVARNLLPPASSRLLLDPTSLPTHLTYLNDTPSAMPHVLSRLVARGLLHPAATYCEPSRMAKLGRLVHATLAWLVGVPGPADQGQPLVVVGLVEQAAQRIVDAWQAENTGSLEHCLMSVGDFRRRFARCLDAEEISSTDASVLLRLLEHQGRVAVNHPQPAEHPDARLVKFASPEAPLSRPHITQADIAAFRLLRVHAELQTQVEALEARAGELWDQAKRALTDARKEQARALLRLHYHVQRTLLPARRSSMDAVERAMRTLEQSKADAVVLAAMEQAARALKEINSQVSPQRVDAVVEQWADAVDDAAVVDGLMAEAARDIARDGAADEAEEEELERELEEMMQKDEAQKRGDVLMMQKEEEPLKKETVQSGDALADALHRVHLSPEPDLDTDTDPQPPLPIAEDKNTSHSPERIPLPAE